MYLPSSFIKELFLIHSIFLFSSNISVIKILRSSNKNKQLSVIGYGKSGIGID